MSKFFLGLVAVLILGAVGIHAFGAGERAEEKIALRLASALESAGADWVVAEFDGQKVILKGAAPDEAAMRRAEQAAKRALGPGGIVFGAVTRVETRFTTPPAEPTPPSPLLSQAAGEIDKLPAPPPTRPQAEPIAPPAADEPGAPDEMDDARIAGRRIRACQTEIDRLLAQNPIRFSSGDAAISEKQRARLDAIAAAIGQCGDVAVTVEGHSDASGRAADNLALSRRRAAAAAAYLGARAGGKARLQSAGYGETRPVASNETEEGRARNRRIEIKIAPGAAAGDEE